MKILMIGPIEKTGGVSTHAKELVDNLRKTGNQVEVYNISPKGTHPSSISNLIKLYKRTIGISLKLIKDSKDFDIVHIQASGPIGGFIPAIVGSFWGRILKFNLLVTFHYGEHEWFIRRYKKIFKLVLRSVKVFFLVSKRQWENFAKVFDEQEMKRLVLIPNGFDSKLFHPMDQVTAREKLGLPLNKKILLNVANLVPIKGHSYLLQAMGEVVKHRKDVMLVIVGDGPLRKKLERQVKMLGLEGYVRFAGSRPHSEIPLWMNAADLFVLPSLNEGNPTVMFEALGVGLPFVGTSVGGVPEIITSEDYGLLCPPKDPECLAEKILIALDKEWDRERIRRYAEQFSWERIARQVVEVYKEVLGNART